MGIYLNPGNDAFLEASQSEIYVDKTDLIAYTNRVLGTVRKNIFVSRPRRFGESMVANMLCAYYSSGCNSAALFQHRKIAQDASFPNLINEQENSLPDVLKDRPKAPRPVYRFYSGGYEF